MFLAFLALFCTLPSNSSTCLTDSSMHLFLLTSQNFRMVALISAKLSDGVHTCPKRYLSHSGFAMSLSLFEIVVKQVAPNSPKSAHHSTSGISTFAQLVRVKINKTLKVLLKLLFSSFNFCLAFLWVI